MAKKLKRYFLCFALAFMLLISFSGCWDSRELDALFIVTAIGMDAGTEQETARVTFEIGPTGSKKTSKEEPSEKSSEPLVFQSTAKTIGESINELNRNSSRTLLFQHNQVLLIGSELAEQGVEGWLDPLVRNQEGRLEILFMVSDGPAEDLLKEKLDQDDITGMYIAHMMQDMTAVSPYYQVRLLDFISSLRTGITSPVAPIVKMEDSENGKTLRITGLAVFKEDKMVGRLTMEQFVSYVWTMGKVERCSVVAQCDQGRAVFNIGELTSKHELTLNEKNEVQIKIKTEAMLSVGELHGFANISAKELLPHLKQIAQEQIEAQILDTFKAAQSMQTDIYKIGSKLSKVYPKQWAEMGQDWDSIFAQLQPEVTVNAKVAATGQIMESIEMKEAKNEN